MDLLICLGGTGQLVLHYALQWHLLGLESDTGPLRALVIDQDQSLASIRFTAGFFARLSDTRGLLPCGEAAPWIREARLEIADSHARLETLLAGETAHALHPARAFFDRGSLAQEVTEGLYGRPCLAPVLWPRHAEPIRHALDAACQEGAGSGHALRATIVGSIVGGAGGGLLLPVVKHLLAQPMNVQVSAVLLERWFHAPTLSADLGRRQDANRAGVLRTLNEELQTASRFLLHHLVVLNGSEPRNEEEEKRAQRLPWPEATHPLGAACFAVHRILRERVADNPVRITDMTLPPAEMAAAWSAARDAQRRGSAAVRTLITESVIERMASDPAAGLIWGRKLTETLAQFWELWSRSRPSEAAVFPRRVDSELRRWLTAAPYSLGSLFPQGDRAHGAEALRRAATNLPAAIPNAGASERLPERAALHLLYHLLQGAK